MLIFKQETIEDMIFKLQKIKGKIIKKSKKNK